MFLLISTGFTFPDVFLSFTILELSKKRFKIISNYVTLGYVSFNVWRNKDCCSLLMLLRQQPDSSVAMVTQQVANLLHSRISKPTIIIHFHICQWSFLRTVWRCKLGTLTTSQVLYFAYFVETNKLKPKQNETQQKKKHTCPKLG